MLGVSHAHRPLRSFDRIPTLAEKRQIPFDVDEEADEAGDKSSGSPSLSDRFGSLHGHSPVGSMHSLVEGSSSRRSEVSQSVEVAKVEADLAALTSDFKEGKLMAFGKEFIESTTCHDVYVATRGSWRLSSYIFDTIRPQFCRRISPVGSTSRHARGTGEIAYGY